MTDQFNVRLEQDTIRKINELCAMLYRDRQNLITWLVDEKYEDALLAKGGVTVIRTIRPEIKSEPIAAEE